MLSDLVGRVGEVAVGPLDRRPAGRVSASRTSTATGTRSRPRPRPLAAAAQGSGGAARRSQRQPFLAISAADETQIIATRSSLEIPYQRRHFVMVDLFLPATIGVILHHRSRHHLHDAVSPLDPRRGFRPHRSRRQEGRARRRRRGDADLPLDRARQPEDAAAAGRAQQEGLADHQGPHARRHRRRVLCAGQAGQRQSSRSRRRRSAR